MCLLHSGTSMLCGECAFWHTELAVLMLLYSLERHKRNLWGQQAMARLAETQVSGLLEVQPTALILCDFNGHLLLHNSAAAVYAKTYAPNHHFTSPLFTELLRKCCETNGVTKRLEGPSDSLSITVTCQRTTWFSRNCALLTFMDVTDMLRSFTALSKVDTKVLNEVGTIERDVNRKFRDTNDPSTQLELCRLHNILHEVNSSLAFQRAFTSRYEVVPALFLLRTEFLDCVEFSSPMSETKALNVVLSFEPCVPSKVQGDKVAVDCMFTYAYRRVIEASNRGSQVSIRITIPSALMDTVKVAVNFDFLTSDPQTLLADFKLKETEFLEEVGLGAFQSMLKAMNGNCSAEQMTFEGSVKRIHIRYEFYVKPEDSGEGRFFQPMASPIRQDLSVDKFKWDYLDYIGGPDRDVVRKRYVKRPSEKRKNHPHNVAPILTTATGLQPIIETNSSEQLDKLPQSQVHMQSEEEEYLDRMVSEQIQSSGDETVTKHYSRSETSPLLCDFLEVPAEVERETNLMCRSFMRNHCDLARVSSSRTTSQGSSPHIHAG